MICRQEDGIKQRMIQCWESGRMNEDENTVLKP